MKSNVEIVRQGYADFQQGNIPAVLELLSDNVTWELPASAGVPFSGVFKGKEGVLTFFKNVGELNEFQEFSPDSFVSEGDRVIALGHLVAKSKTTGKTSANKWAHVWTLREGKVIAHFEYVDTAEIKEAFS